MIIPQIVGVLNITPDSFSDGGEFYNIFDAIKHVHEMIASGVDIIDVGAVSTRPDGTIVSYAEEINRLHLILPEIKNIVSGTKIRISLDSCNYQTIAKFLPYIDIINDVTGLDDINMQAVSLESGKEIIFMHSMGVPVNNALRCLDPQIDVIEFLLNWRDKKLAELISKGFKSENLVFDPGIGFAKDAHQSMSIIEKIKELVNSKTKILVAYSRKSFLAVLGEKDAQKRDPETHVITSYLLDKNIDYIRVHDVFGTSRVMKLHNMLYR